MQLELLVKRLAVLEAQPEVADDQGPAFDVEPQPIPGYVSPTFTVEEWPENAPVLLVEAPGAVGKSAAASALAAALNWPLIRAEKAQVGDYTLLGLIQDALGPTSNYVRDIALAETGVVIDSLDEAHLRAGSDNFFAFINNVIKVSGAQILPSVRPPSVILLSRSDAAELIELAFADQGVPLARARLDFFGFKPACDFIASYLRLRFNETGRPEYNVAMAAQRPFESLRDGRMTQIARVLLARPDVNIRHDWDEVKDFLGYAPVLIALAESLAVMNPSAQAVELHATDEGRLLREIVNYILVREQGKFSEHMGPKLQALLPADVEQSVVSAALYAPREQAIRLLGFAAGIELATSLPGNLPDAVRVHYEEAVDTFLPDHPFIKSRTFASLVFSDFVLAITTANIDASLSLGRDSHLLLPAVGPFYARFLGQESAEDSRVEIPESAIESVLWSWNQEAELAGSSTTDARVVLMEDNSHLICWRKEGDSWVDLEFDVGSTTGALFVARPLRNVSIITDGGLILGNRSGHLQLGPDVLVLARELVIDAENLRILGDGVRLGAETCLANQLTRVEAGDEALSIYVDQPPARLRPYMRSLKYKQFSVPYQVFVDLRSVFGAFKSTIHGCNANAQRLENKVIKGSERRQKMLDHLMEKGIIGKSGIWYQMDLNALGTIGFGLQDLRAGQPSSAVLSFLVNCGHGEPVLDELP